jgi:hypothetical protein
MVQQLLTEWLTLAALVVGPGLVAGLFWAPFLAVDRFASLFERLPPRDSVAVSYPLVTVGLSLPWIAAAGRALVRRASDELTAANGLLDVIVVLSGVYLLVLPLVAGLGLPRVGIDWDETGYGPRTWILLGIGTLWYVLLLALPIFALSIGLALAGGP